MLENKNFKIIYNAGLYFFAGLGLFFVVGFLAVKYDLTNAFGDIDLRDRYFSVANSKNKSLLASTSWFGGDKKGEYECRANILSQLYPLTGGEILSLYRRTGDAKVLVKMVTAAEVYLTGDDNYQRRAETCLSGTMGVAENEILDLYGWRDTEEWQVFKEAVLKDTEVIKKVSNLTGVDSRELVSLLVGEQLRLYHSEREVYKQFFAPLKILGNETKFSWGVFGIKEETAKQIENNLTDHLSPFYLGLDYENLLSWKTANHDEERFYRLTDEDDRYYPYLYAALLVKQLESQWEKAGFPIADRPEIVGTLFNIGFDKSEPKANPQVGGAEIEINGQVYTFGALAHQFYYSGEMAEEFPLK